MKSLQSLVLLVFLTVVLSGCGGAAANSHDFANITDLDGQVVTLTWFDETGAKIEFNGLEKWYDVDRVRVSEATIDYRGLSGERSLSYLEYDANVRVSGTLKWDGDSVTLSTQDLVGENDAVVNNTWTAFVANASDNTQMFWVTRDALLVNADPSSRCDAMKLIDSFHFSWVTTVPDLCKSKDVSVIEWGEANGYYYGGDQLFETTTFNPTNPKLICGNLGNDVIVKKISHEINVMVDNDYYYDIYAHDAFKIEMSYNGEDLFVYLFYWSGSWYIYNLQNYNIDPALQMECST